MHVYNVCKGHVAAYRANMLKAMLQMNADGSDITQQQQQVSSTKQDLDGPKWKSWQGRNTSDWAFS